MLNLEVDLNNDSFLVFKALVYRIDLNKDYIRRPNSPNSLDAKQFFKLLLSSVDFFQSKLFQKLIKAYHFSVKIVWIQTRPDSQSGLTDLICVQSVCKGYQQTTKPGASKEKVNEKMFYSIMNNKEADQHLYMSVKSKLCLSSPMIF